jgi:hypothetical protein
MYFAIYQALAEDERRLGLLKSYAPDFFDLVIVDECHRGSARSPFRSSRASQSRTHLWQGRVQSRCHEAAHVRARGRMMREWQKIDPVHALPECVPRNVRAGNLIISVQEHIEATTPWHRQQLQRSERV